MISYRMRQTRFYGSLLSFFASLTILLLYFHQPLQILPLGFVWHREQNGTAAFPADDKLALRRDPPPDGPPFGAVVIAGQAVTKLNWTKLVDTEYSVYPYNVDAPDNTDSRLQIPKNKGREAMVYLSWIVENYDNLPWAGIFVHGHAESWHQTGDVAHLIQGLNRTSLARAGYISLRCDWEPSCPAEMQLTYHEVTDWEDPGNVEAVERVISGNWRLLFPEENKPKMLASPCCAQFAVTRQAIRRRTKEDYVRIRDWLVQSLLIDDFSGRVLEKLWAYLFTRNSVQ